MKRLKEAMRLNDAQIQGIAMFSLPAVIVAAESDHAVWMIPSILGGVTLLAIISNLILND